MQEPQETWIRSMGQEDPLEEGMATHSSILAWRIPWTEEPGGLQSIGLQRVRHDQATYHTCPIQGALNDSSYPRTEPQLLSLTPDYWSEEPRLPCNAKWPQNLSDLKPQRHISCSFNVSITGQMRLCSMFSSSLWNQNWRSNTTSDFTGYYGRKIRRVLESLSVFLAITCYAPKVNTTVNPEPVAKTNKYDPTSIFCLPHVQRRALDVGEQKQWIPLWSTVGRSSVSACAS